eukprot:COSAG02_NODE_1236_length_13732_cov_5.596787_2_plen_101_part_00
MHITGHASSKEIIGDSLLGVKTPTAALVFRCATLCRNARCSPQECRGAWPMLNLNLCLGALRRVVEQYLWHEKTKGRKHKMQIHTYHKVSLQGAQYSALC